MDKMSKEFEAFCKLKGEYMLAHQKDALDIDFTENAERYAWEVCWNARATSELSEDDEKSEILANFFKESIAIIDKARKEIREKYPKMFEDEPQADKPISIPHGPYPKPKFYPPVYDKFDYDRVALLERADKYLKTLIDDGFEDGTTYHLIKDLITPSQ